MQRKIFKHWLDNLSMEVSTMNDLKLGQEFVTAVTSDPNAEDCPVIGASQPMTEEEWKAALPGILAEGEELYKAAFIARFVELGVPDHIGEAEWDAYRETLKDDEQKPTPIEAADICMSYWDAD